MAAFGIKSPWQPRQSAFLGSSSRLIGSAERGSNRQQPEDRAAAPDALLVGNNCSKVRIKEAGGGKERLPSVFPPRQRRVPQCFAPRPANKGGDSPPPKMKFLFPIKSPNVSDSERNAATYMRLEAPRSVPVCRCPAANGALRLGLKDGA